MADLEPQPKMQPPVAESTFVTPRDYINAPPLAGRWDFFLSHTQRDGEAKTMAREIFFGMQKPGHDRHCWLDVEMDKCDVAAMEEGVRNNKCLIAIVTDNAVDPYFSRWMCRDEIKWALDAGIPSVPVVAAVDKLNIGDLIEEGQTGTNAEGQTYDLDFSSNNFVHLDYSRPLYLEASLETVILKKIANGEMAREDKITATSSAELGQVYAEQNAMRLELQQNTMQMELQQNAMRMDFSISPGKLAFSMRK